MKHVLENVTLILTIACAIISYHEKSVLIAILAGLFCSLYNTIKDKKNDEKRRN